MKGRGAGGKAKQAKRRRDIRKQCASIPEVIDVQVYMPNGQQVELRSISIDLVGDLRLLLKQRPAFCHLTNYSFHHEARGQVTDQQQVQSLRPLQLQVRFEDYEPQHAWDHLRGILEITACIDMLGPRTPLQEPCESNPPPAGGGKDEDTDCSACGGLKISSSIQDFYAPFSLAACDNPLKGLRVLNSANDGPCAFPEVEFTEGNGNAISVSSCRAGFYADGSLETCKHSLVELLQVASPVFESKWAALMAALADMYPHGNLPSGIVANTWLAPPCMAAAPHSPKLLPAEDAALGAQNLGCARPRFPEQQDRNWLAEFAEARKLLRAAASASETDTVYRRIFLSHCSYADTGVVQAVEAASAWEESSIAHSSAHGLDVVATPEPLDLRPGQTASGAGEQCTKGLLKGLSSYDPITASSTLEPVVVHHLGRKVVVTPAAGRALEATNAPEEGDEPAAARCGDVYLKTNSMRRLLHACAPPERGSGAEAECLASGASALRQVLDRCAEALHEPGCSQPALRWELAVSWAQYLKEPPSEGPGAKRAPGSSFRASPKAKVPPMVLEGGSDEGEAALRGEMGEEAFAALAKQDVGLHRFSPAELHRRASEWYYQVALPRVVWELRRLEVAPVDGLTLVDFLHSRGINIRHLGAIVKLNTESVSRDTESSVEQGIAVSLMQRQAGQAGPESQDKPRFRVPGTMAHITAVCRLDMVARALKHLLRAVISSVRNGGGSGLDVASSVAAALNAALGSPDAAHHEALWSWLRSYVARRYKHVLPEAGAKKWLRPQALFRVCCQKVGLEVCAKGYDFEGASPVSPADIVSVVPVAKVPPFSLAEPRQYLESAKSYMDAGNLADAAASATTALLRLRRVVGAHHKLCAGAYSLLAVVLYHTTDFLQAAYLQQKALIINERALGLDHPDTLKSYGDLSVFYYRLQHHELALRYVLRGTYMLGLTCGPAHPNTAATYVNIAMMKEGLGNSGAALRYLHAALKCNTALLGSEHVQTAASYHAMAIALSLMEPPLYSLSMQHERTCLESLERQLGPHDLRTQDAAAWFEYFSQKAAEQAAASRSGGANGKSAEKSIASKGHLPVKDLMAYLGESNARQTSQGPKKGASRPHPGKQDEQAPPEEKQRGSGASAPDDACGDAPVESNQEFVQSKGSTSPVSVLSEGAEESAGEEDSAEWVEVKPQRFARARGGLYRKTTQRGQRYLRNEAEPAAHRSIDAKSREALPSKAAAEAASADASIATQQSQQGSMGCNRQDSPSTPEIPAPAVPKGSASPAIGFPAGEPASPGSRLDPRAAEFVPPHWAVMQQYGPGCDAVAGWHFPPPPYPWMYSYPMLIPPCYPIPPGPVIMPMPIHMPPPPPPFRSCPPPDHTAMGQAVAQPAPLVPVTPPPLGTAASPSPEANNAPAAMIHPQQTGTKQALPRSAVVVTPPATPARAPPPAAAQATGEEGLSRADAAKGNEKGQ